MVPEPSNPASEPLNQAEEDSLERYNRLAVSAEQRLCRFELAEFEREESRWFSGDRPGRRLLRQVRERHRTPNTLGYKEPWIFRILPQPPPFEDGLFAEDEPMPETDGGFDATKRHFPVAYILDTTAAMFISPHYPWGPAIWSNAITFNITNDRALIGKSGLMWIEAPEGLQTFAQAFVPFVSVGRHLLWAFALAIISTRAALKRLEIHQPDLYLYFALPRGVEIPTKIILPDNMRITNRSFLREDGSRVVPEEVVLEVRPRPEEGAKSTDPRYGERSAGEEN